VTRARTRVRLCSFDSGRAMIYVSWFVGSSCELFYCPLVFQTIRSVTEEFYKCSGVLEGREWIQGGRSETERRGTCGQKRLLHTEIGVGTYSLSVVYQTPVEAEDLEARILTTCETIQNTPGIFGRVRQNMVRGCRASREDCGHHFEQRMWTNLK
jgi:hypothetical protein